MKILEITGYCENVPSLAILVDKIVAVAVCYNDMNKTAIWVDGVEQEFVSSDCYSTVMEKLRKC